MADRQLYSTSNPPMTHYGHARDVKAYGGALSLLTTDLALNRTVALFRVPQGFTVTGLSVSTTDMDSNGTPTLTFKLGDTGDDDRLLAASTIAQTGTNNYTGLVPTTGLLYQYTAETEILFTCSAAAATAVAGTLTVVLFGYIA
jgi:hypothetical protein